MKSVRDIFVEVLLMKREGVPPNKVGRRMIATGQDSGFQTIRETDDYDLREYEFPTGDVIVFDGSNWHHRRPPRGS
jgi:hypothetical protein